MVEEIREETSVPFVFLTYLNPVHNYGYYKFFNRCNEIGVDGIIIPDLPFEERDEVNHIALKNNVDIISLISPTSKERINAIAKESRGFVYIVSSMGVTGVRNNIKTDISTIVDMVKEVTSIPCAVGFGINTPKQCREISKYADGVIVGSAIVKIIENYGVNAGEHVYKYVKEMKEALV
ncbi:Tryptophan synthase alpha chain [bioreactor metagenome]|uniref:tryptophan synthase n=2 Tax=root TaxID=1 RepID=A0A645B118_9ZZZZ